MKEIRFNLTINIDGHKLYSTNPLYNKNTCKNYGGKFTPKGYSINGVKREINLTQIEKELLEKNRELYKIIEEDYPEIKIRGYFENETEISFGTTHNAWTNIRTFKETFGRNIKKDYYLRTTPFFPIPISFFSCYDQKGKLTIPKKLQEIVAEISINDSPVLGSFGFLKL